MFFVIKIKVIVKADKKLLKVFDESQKKVWGATIIIILIENWKLLNLT